MTRDEATAIAHEAIAQAERDAKLLGWSTDSYGRIAIHLPHDALAALAGPAPTADETEIREARWRAVIDEVTHAVLPAVVSLTDPQARLSMQVRIANQIIAHLLPGAPPAALLAASPAVPEGWVLVPVEPTREMRRAFHQVDQRIEDNGGDTPDDQWSAMLAAAPTPPAPIPSTPDAPGVDALREAVERALIPPPCALGIEQVTLLTKQCDFCADRMMRCSIVYEARRALEALTTRPATPDEAAIMERCWSCSCGWSGRYSPEEIRAYGEPDECNRCHGERIWEIEPTAIRAGLSRPVETAGEVEAFRPMEAWDNRDETVLLMVDYRGEDADHPIADADFALTIGHNNDHNVGEGEGQGWLFAGWCWTHDHYVQGGGTPVAWMPLPHARALRPPTPSPSVGEDE